MTIETEIAALTTATTALTSAVNVAKATLDQKVIDASTQATLATTNGATQVALAAAQATLATTNGATQVALAAAQATSAATSATTAGTAAAQASTANASAATQASAATSSATAANAALLALGNVLANGVGVITVDANGDLSVAYNSPTVTSMAIDGAGNFTVTYPA